MIALSLSRRKAVNPSLSVALVFIVCGALAESQEPNEHARLGWSRFHVVYECRGNPVAALVDASSPTPAESRFCRGGRPGGGRTDTGINRVPSTGTVSLSTLAAPRSALKAYAIGSREMERKTPNFGKAAQA